MKHKPLLNDETLSRHCLICGKIVFLVFESFRNRSYWRHEPEKVSVYDPDGDERRIYIQEALDMIEKGEAILCPPEEAGIEGNHVHRHERWENGEQDVSNSLRSVDTG